MLVAQIKTDSRIYSLYSDDISSDNIVIYGHFFENNKFYPLNNEVFDEFRKLKLGNNYKKIDTFVENNISYDVILDLNTNLKHYFNNGKENVQLFFNNFKPLIIASNKKHKIDLPSIGMAFSLLTAATGCIIVLGALIPSISHANISITQPLEYQEIIEQLNNTPEFTVDTIKNIINSNPNLDEYDKKIILNEELLNFAIPYINMNKEYRAELYNFILPELTIEKKDIDSESIIGLRYYNTIEIDINKINNSDMNTEEFYIDTLTHEFAHILQPYSKQYSFLYEGFTEMISNEFSYCEHDPNNAYSENQKYISVLMEIIGTEPIIDYCFTGNTNYIRNELQPYLTEEHLSELLSCFKIRDNDDNFTKVHNLLNEAFYNKYGLQIQESALTNMYLNQEHNFSFFNVPTNEAEIIITHRKMVIGFKSEGNQQIPIYEEKTLYTIDESQKNKIIDNGLDYDKIYVPKDVLLTSTSLTQAVDLVQRKTR